MEGHHSVLSGDKVVHILFFTDNFPPETNAPASRTFEHAREWVRNGHEVTIITCVPNFPKGKIFPGYRNKLWQSEIIEGIRTIRVWSYVTSNDGFAKRIADYASYMVTGFFASFFVRRVDVVIGTSPQFFTVLGAWAAAATRRVPFVFELRDLWPESIRAVSAMHDSRTLDLLERVELFLYRRARGIVSVTRSFKRNLIDRGIPGEKISVVTNGVDTSLFSPMPKDERLEREFDLRGCFVAGYIGTHGMAHALDTVLDAARLLSDDPEAENIRILMVGDGALRDQLMRRARAEGLHNVLFIGSVSKAEVVRYWSLLDTSIIHLKRTALFKSVIPSKLFECMAMGIPILHGVEGESAEIVVENGVGLTFEPENPVALAQSIKKLAQNGELRASMSSRGPQAASVYDRRKLAQKMFVEISKFAASSR